jgi:hypothetical protein
MVGITNIKIGLAKSADDLKEMYQVNRALYDKLKALDAKAHSDLIDNITAMKKSFF